MLCSANLWNYSKHLDLVAPCKNGFHSENYEIPFGLECGFLLAEIYDNAVELKSIYFEFSANSLRLPVIPMFEGTNGNIVRRWLGCSGSSGN